MNYIPINSRFTQQCYVDALPSKCPYCHQKITPNLIAVRIINDEAHLFYECPDVRTCKQSFIAFYRNRGSNQFSYLETTTSGSIIGKTFSETIDTISNSFVIIYNQAFTAEQQNLTEICGVGYRKALEFLIKDYAIKKNPTQKENIEKKMLAQCIGDYVTDEKIKSVSKRAVWLGNDETHYTRKWDGKNLSDLKKLIDLTLHWIEAEVLTESFEDEMPG